MWVSNETIIWVSDSQYCSPLPILVFETRPTLALYLNLFTIENWFQTTICSMQLQYTVRKQYDRKVWKSNKCAQLGCTVHCGKFKPVDIVVIDKTDSLVCLGWAWFFKLCSYEKKNMCVKNVIRVIVVMPIHSELFCT